jgi:hypothetical protein
LKGIAKQNVGFRFGKHRLSVLRLFGEAKVDGRKYTLVEVETAIGQRYYALRLYNAQGKFIKQILFEGSVAIELANLILLATHSGSLIAGGTMSEGSEPRSNPQSQIQNSKLQTGEAS